MRQFQDENLLTWEVYASEGALSLPDHARLVFQCATQRERPARSVTIPGDLTDAEAGVEGLPDEKLRRLLAESREIP